MKIDGKMDIDIGSEEWNHDILKNAVSLRLLIPMLWASVSKKSMVASSRRNI